MTDNDIVTITDSATASAVKCYSGQTRDHVILIREAVHALRTEAAGKISVTVHKQDWTLTVKARR